MKIIDHARTLGITLKLDGDMVRAVGDRGVIQAFGPTIKANKAQIIRELNGEVPFPRSRHLVDGVEIICTPPAADGEIIGKQLEDW